MNVRVPRDIQALPPERRAAMEAALAHAVLRASEWGLPELTAEEPRSRAVGWLTRDRALVVIERDLVNLSAQRRRRAPWGSLWAPDWWSQIVLPAAAAQTSAAWWARRAPRPAVEWARLLDPSSDAGASRDTDPRETDERGA
ncbi:hypothetical protein GCM10028787_31300 [Brachybacterium horti]